MTLSRTARILIALLLVAAAAFIWLNLFITSPASGPILTRTAATPVQAANQPATAPDDEDGADPFAQVQDPDAPAGEDAADGEGPAELPFITIPADGDEGADAPSDGAAGDGDGAGPQAPTVVAPDETTVVGRDVVVAEFPFLITAPPLTQGAEEPAAEAAAAGASRPGTVARASVNPFSPIVVQAPPEAAAEPPPAGPEVVEVEVPSGPPQANAAPATRAPSAAATPAPAVPAPRPMAPNTAGARQLPRALPTGTLPVAPDLLREPRAEAAPRTPVTVPNVAIREPESETAGAPDLAPVDADLTAGAAGELAPLGPGEIPASGRPEMPLVAGADPLSRYLRDRNVTFTGSVVGSVGVGVFRTIDQNAPIVLALGQTLPDSDIVLTDLRGQAAEFTLGDTSQVLNLDLRR